MSSFMYVVVYLVKEIVKPRLHHKNATELLEDVDHDVFRKTHSFDHIKYIEALNDLLQEARNDGIKG